MSFWLFEKLTAGELLPPKPHGLGKVGMLAQKRAREEQAVVVTMGVKRAASTVAKCALIMTLVQLEAADDLARQQRLLWWQQSLLKHAPDLSGGDYSYRGALYYGQTSNYGRQHTPPVSPKEFYTFFRFAREHIPRLVLALRMPAVFRTPSRCTCNGEEALLVFLRVGADLGVFISSPPCCAASHVPRLALA